VAVELKLQDWPGALEQARAYSRWANAAWVLLARRPPPAALALAANIGVGVAVLSPSGEVAPLTRPVARRRPDQRWAAIRAGEQVLARALRAGFGSFEASQAVRVPPAMPAGGVAASQR
jgi:hypothetical protein